MKDLEEGIKKAGVNDDPWMLTHSGKQVHFTHPELEDFSIGDITHALGMICRFTGHVSRFYSVAQHSVLVSVIVRHELDKEGVDADSVEYWDQILAALLHDAAESIVGDPSSPLKSAMGGKHKWIEHGILSKIFERYGIDWAYYNMMVREADYHACLIERKELLPASDLWPVTEKLLFKLPEKAMPPALATTAMIDSFDLIVGQRNQARMNSSGDA